MNDSSLIPDEYVADRLEIRRTVIGVILFVIVMICVVGAFFVTNRQWDSIRARQAEVKIRYEDVSTKITRMEELRSTRDDLVKRAELASALVSHVPRSYLLSGLIERMPPRVSWTSLKLASKEIVEAELGRLIGQVYASVDETPLAAASIAQVHRASQGPERGTVPYHIAHPTGRG